MWGSFILVITVCGTVFASLEGGPRLDLLSLESGYHGLVREDELLVEVTPNIRAVGAQICGFRIVNRHHGDAPFEILLKHQETGEAELRAKKRLNCEKRKNYKFDIAAVSCAGDLSPNATVHISVVDVNEFAPTFLEPAYVKQVDEGKIYSEILQVEATDRDCTPKFGDICKYEILTTDQPFTINMDGVIRNTEPLDYEKSHNHILSVVAYDCGMKKAAPVMVTIRVNRVCKLGWKGIPERIDYAPSTGRQNLFPEASLELCDIPCSPTTLQSKVHLATSHIGKGCDRDTYSVQSQRKLCGASMESIDMLPSPGLGTEWTKTLPLDEGHESDQIFEFDGASTAVVIPPEVVNHDLSDTFTIATWMKHKPSAEQDKHTKEHIICNADDHKMNRHHYAVFVRNCRLILLLRREFTDGDLNTFRPAEWRWKIPQVCDNEWHHFAVSVKFPDTSLYVDGQLFKPSNNNPEIIDDWPLHPTKGLNTTMTVGACWQGTDNKMKHHFKGYLAGLSILLHKIEKPDVLACLHKCKESLEVPGMELLEPGMELLTNSDLTEMTIEGDNKTNLESLIAQVGYSNAREFPTPGRRNLHIVTKITCESGKTVKVPPVESYIMVLPPQQPTIEINGSSNVTRDYEDFRQGVRVFTDVRVTVSTDKDEEEWKNGEPISVIEKKLDSCTVSVYPSLNPDHETITLPTNMLSQLYLVAKASKEGVVISGADMIYNYEQVLRQIQYTNRKPAYYLQRAFKLICHELNGRFVSNEYIQTLTVSHPDMVKKDSNKTPISNHIPDHSDAAQSVHNPSLSNAAHAQVNSHHVEFKPAQTFNNMYLTSNLMDTSQAVAVTGGSHAVTIIIVVCVGFLLFMIVLGVIRIRAAHQRAQQEEIADTEMAWDDSALNITINPMEQLAAPVTHNSKEEDDDDDDSSDDASSYHDDGDSSDDDPETKAKDLEWDNSTLNI